MKYINSSEYSTSQARVILLYFCDAPPAGLHFVQAIMLAIVLDVVYVVSVNHKSLFMFKVFTNKDGDREKVNDVLVIFTSRIHPTQLEDVLKRAHKLKKRKVEIITVYFKHTKMTWNVKDELTAIASIPENVLTLRPQKKLKKTLKRRICPSVRAMRKYHSMLF